MYLVTGGAGFIGSNLVETLLCSGKRVRVLDDFSTGKSANLDRLAFKYPKFLEVINGTICNIETCRKSVLGVRYIAHLAAIPSVGKSIEYPIETHTANINGTLNLLLAAKENVRLKKFVMASSSSAYGDIDTVLKSENLPGNPLSPYAVQKVSCEMYCKIFWQLFRVPTVILRYFNVFGPNQDPDSQYSAVIPRFIHAFLGKGQLEIYGDGLQCRDFTYVSNVVDGNLKAFESEINGEVINIACGEKVDLNTLISILESIFKKKINVNYLPRRSGDVMFSLADISKAKRLLGYVPSVMLAEGLDRTVHWYQNQNYA